MSLICIGDQVVTPDGVGEVVDMNARKETVLVRFVDDAVTFRMMWYSMLVVTREADLPDFSDLDQVEAYLAAEPSTKELPDAAKLKPCECSCGRQKGCGTMSSNGFHTPIHLGCKCLLLDCVCVGGGWA